MAYNPTNVSNAARALEAQSLFAVIDLSTAAAVVSDIETCTASGAAATKTILLDVGQPVAKCLGVKIIDRATGAVVATTALPSLAVANKISVVAVGTAITSALVEFIYIVA